MASATFTEETKSGQKDVIIWAVDPTQDPAEAKDLVKELKIWSKYLDCDVQPVALYASAMGNLPLEMPYPWDEEFPARARTALHKQVRKANGGTFLPPIALFVPYVSTRKMAYALAKYAQKQKAQMVFVNTRAARTRNPFRLGGFAETLITTSRTPVLALNPSAAPPHKIRKILFPTDFGQHSKRALELLKPWAKAAGAQVVLFNQVELPTIYPSEFASAPPAASAEGLVEDTEQARRVVAAEWCQSLKEDGLKTSLMVQRQKKYLAAEILDAAKKNKIDLIALASDSGPYAQTILGSTARDVLLKATCPVLVFYRPKLVRKKHIVHVPTGARTEVPSAAAEPKTEQVAH